MKILTAAASSSLVLCARLALGCVPAGTLDPSTGTTSTGSSSSAGGESGHGGMAGTGTAGGGGTTASSSSSSGQGGADTCIPTKKPAPMPIAVSLPAATAGQDGRIYVFGGGTIVGNIEVPTNAVNAYDPCSNVWTPRAPMPTPRLDAAATTGLDGKIYVLGGLGGGVKLDRAEAYDPATNLWATLPPMPTARAWLGAATGPDGLIYAIGGLGVPDGGSNGYAIVEAYDPMSGMWTTKKKAMTFGREQFGVASGPDGFIYAIGGCGASADTGLNVESYDVKNTEEGDWTPVAPLPGLQSFGGAALGSDGRIYYIGGRPQCFGVGTNTALAYSVLTKTWTFIPNVPTPGCHLVAATGKGGLLYVIGGGACFNITSTVVQAYDPATNTW